MLFRSKEEEYADAAYNREPQRSGRYFDISIIVFFNMMIVVVRVALLIVDTVLRRDLKTRVSKIV